MRTRFLIATMHCGERDFDRCVASIKTQEGDLDVEHIVFKDMVEVDAHNAVYQAFNAADPDVICGKVDADVELQLNALMRIKAVCGRNSWVDPQTHDYFTDNPLCAGVAFYGADVTFKHQHLTLKCDRDIASRCDHVGIGVIGLHAHQADPWTGFRYGFHRGLKSQLPVHEAVKRAYAAKGGEPRRLAIIGFELAQSDLYVDYHLKGEPPPMDHNYGDPKLLELFEMYSMGSAPVPPRTWR